MNNGQPKVAFLRLVELFDGKAQTITNGILFCQAWDLDIHNQLCGLGSDGASVMLGRRAAVAKMLKDEVPFLVVMYCTLTCTCLWPGCQ